MSPTRRSREERKNERKQFETHFSLYDARGEPVATTASHGSSRAPVVADYFDNRVQVAIERDRERNAVEVYCVVRGRRNAHERLNTYYVRFRFGPAQDTAAIRTDLHRFLTNDVALKLADPSVDQGAAVHHVLTTPERSHLSNGTVDHLDAILCEELETAGITVPHEGTAVAMAGRLLDQTKATTVIVTRKAGGLEQFDGTVDAVLQVRDCPSVQLGEATERAVADHRAAVVENRIEDHLDAIGDEIAALEETTYLDAVEIRRRVGAELPPFSRTQRAKLWLADMIPDPLLHALHNDGWLARLRLWPRNNDHSTDEALSSEPTRKLPRKVRGALVALLLSAIGTAGLLYEMLGIPSPGAFSPVDGSVIQSLAEQYLWQAIVSWVQIPGIGVTAPAWSIGLSLLVLSVILVARLQPRL